MHKIKELLAATLYINQTKGLTQDGELKKKSVLQRRIV